MSVTGSTYRRAGARMVLNSERWWGLMSGGCLETEIWQRSKPLVGGASENLEFEIDTRRLLGCDGRLTLLAEPLSKELWDSLVALVEQRETAFAVTCAQSGTRVCRSLPETQEGELCQPLEPLVRLWAFGATPDAVPLVEMARCAGWEAEQLVLAGDPQAGSRSDWRQVTQPARLPVDHRTACVIMNHHFSRDLELLTALWNSSTPYLGLLGSRKRRDQLLEELAFGRPQGVSLESRELFAPAGLDLGGEGPSLIALEICAQVQQVMSQFRTKR